jgi:gamma-glutamylcyclotransferase (GGCT)/AIG2-like uncharacterized protein YtfP
LQFFFYGTLLDDELRRAVIGHSTTLVPATLTGWRRFTAKGKPFPMIVRDPAAAVDGAVSATLDARAVARLRRYEGHGYETTTVRVVRGDGTAAMVEAFLPRAGSLAPGGEWSLAEWQRRDRALALEQLRDLDLEKADG